MSNHTVFLTIAILNWIYNLRRKKRPMPLFVMSTLSLAESLQIQHSTCLVYCPIWKVQETMTTMKKTCVDYNFNLKKTKGQWTFITQEGGQGQKRKAASFCISFPTWKNSPETWKNNTDRKTWGKGHDIFQMLHWNNSTAEWDIASLRNIHTLQML